MADVTTVLRIRIDRLRALGKGGVKLDVSTAVAQDQPTVRATNAQAAKDIDTGYLVAVAL